MKDRVGWQAVGTKKICFDSSWCGDATAGLSLAERKTSQAMDV